MMFFFQTCHTNWDTFAVILQPKKSNIINMTLKGLLISLSFDEIAPYLIRQYTYDNVLGDLVANTILKSIKRFQLKRFKI